MHTHTELSHRLLLSENKILSLLQAKKKKKKKGSARLKTIHELCVGFVSLSPNVCSSALSGVPGSLLNEVL